MLLRAHVQHGRIVVNEPTDLPDGTELELVTVGDAGLDEADLERLRAAIREGLAQGRRGETLTRGELHGQLQALDR